MNTTDSGDEFSTTEEWDYSATNDSADFDFSTTDDSSDFDFSSTEAVLIESTIIDSPEITEDDSSTTEAPDNNENASGAAVYAFSASLALIAASVAAM